GLSAPLDARSGEPRMCEQPRRVRLYLLQRVDGGRVGRLCIEDEQEPGCAAAPTAAAPGRAPLVRAARARAPAAARAVLRGVRRSPARAGAARSAPGCRARTRPRRPPPPAPRGRSTAGRG